MVIKYKAIFFLLPAAMIMASCCNTKNENLESAERYFEKIKREGDNAKLTMFFTQMPKGGDLHHHYSGALYAETYLQWAAEEHLRLNTNTCMLNTGKSAITIDSLIRNDVLYRHVLEEWSDADFSNNFHLENPPDQHFFNTFPYFGKIAGTNCRAGLADIKEEAKKENIQYIETMLCDPKVPVHFSKGMMDSLAYCQGMRDTLRLYQLFNAMAQSIAMAPAYNSYISGFVDSLHSCHRGIDDSDFTMRFQLYAVRKFSPATVFATLYGSFDAVARDKSSLLVGVNIVAPENNYVSMRDYWLHMQMFRFLKRKFPTVKTDMHAGELSLGLVKPQDLTWHIYDAVYIASTNRIGHGVDIPYETQAPEILKKMKEDSIAVEINLTSNEFILGVKGNDHPINLYYDAGVPIVISTDDMGVSRDNLTHEFVLLASRYHFTYKQIKSFVFNSIRFSFLKESEKAALENKLTLRFNAFEAMVARNCRNRN